MARRRSRRSVLAMAFMEELPWVYGAALAASATQDTAAKATASALAGGSGTRTALVAHAIRTAVAANPAPPFDQLEPDAAEALALVRLAGMKVDEVAEVTGVDQAEVKLRLAAALRDLRAGSAPRTPRPPLDFAS
jgi:DNA-directed RNA polymerase specialized sigma24 family protein